MPRVTDPHVILISLAIGAGALLLIGLAAAAFVVASGAWRVAREADRRHAVASARVAANAELRRRVVIEYRAAESARDRARRDRQARRQHEAIMRRMRTELLRQDLEALAASSPDHKERRHA